MLSNNNNSLNNNVNSNNKKRDLLTPFLSPETLLFGGFDKNDELEDIDILGENQMSFCIDPNFGNEPSLLFSSPSIVPFSIENDSSNINEIIDEGYNINTNNNSNINKEDNNNNNNILEKMEFKNSSPVGIYDSSNIFQLPQPQQQDNSNSDSVFENGTNNVAQQPPPLTEPLPLSQALPSFQPLPLPEPPTATMTAKQVNNLIEENQLLTNQNDIIYPFQDDQQDIEDDLHQQPPPHKDRKPRRPPEYPIHQVNLLLDEVNGDLICKECNYKAKTRKSVQSHIRKVHTVKLDKIREDCKEIFKAKKDDYNKDSIVCDHYGCGAIIVKYNKSKHYRQPHHIGHPKEIGECYRCKEVKQRTIMRNLKKEMNKNKR
ncbi:hypothetical protein DICPUDRAFT_82764 [Dictyostelium purpureum]|uniref:C2H2-type domain-containing protein n=1 Tax=Dictyostelium purpureum TaxID=5786 RepID=F0ZXI4_DICPU|nr:uncharacterized protein DICPUDRAFT_82764 [Dictyostelium purpureum]EGC31347.1 hypothetical protein DICPUDRAFT_82764 [Dictyostelium purpureum]|eukprot:XP_003292123.1 hypothetical protein DICPUDRAFT_82764 [Dictyostelium purpureum]